MKLEYYKHLFDGAASDGGDGGANNSDGQSAQGAAGGGASSTGNHEPSSDGEPDAGAKKYTDADVDALFAKKFAALMQKHEKQQAAAVKEAERLAKMSAQERAEHERDELDARREAADRSRSCERKNRYASRLDAEEAIRRCADHGRRGLHCYRCSYCGGWHLTSRQE